MTTFSRLSTSGLSILGVCLAAHLVLVGAPPDSDKEKNRRPAPVVKAAPAGPAKPAAAAPGAMAHPLPAARPNGPGGGQGHVNQPTLAQPGGGMGSRSAAPRQMVRTPGGGEIRRSPSGQVREVRTPGGAVIHHAPNGGRRIEVVRPGGRVVVATGGGRGYVQRPFTSHGHTYEQRTYVMGGRSYSRAYRPWSYGGREYHVYARGRYYRPEYYRWAYTPWQRPYRYGWGWEARPWYGYYGTYFTPYPTYASPAYWLTDYLLATTMEAAYQARSNPSAPPMPGYAMMPLTPGVKQAVVDEVHRQMDMAQEEQAAMQSGAGQSGPPVLFSDRGPRVFVVSSDLSGFVANQDYPLSPGDVLQLAQTPLPGSEFAQVTVLASRASTVPSGSVLAVSTTDLQEQQNTMQTTLDQGLEQLQASQGGLPAAPAAALGGTDAPYAADLAPDPAAANDLTLVVQDADKAEQAVMSQGGEAAPQGDDRLRVLIGEFPVFQGAYEGWNGWGYQAGPGQISDALQDLMITAFVSKGGDQVRLMDRGRLDEVMAERGLGAGLLAEELSAKRMARYLGCRFLLTGRVTRFAYQKSGFSGGWGAAALLSKVSPTLGSLAGDVHVTKASFTGRLDCRLIDLQTGEVLMVSKDEGTVKDVGVKVAGTGTDVQYDQELVSRVFEPVVDHISGELTTRIAALIAKGGYSNPAPDPDAFGVPPPPPAPPVYVPAPQVVAVPAVPFMMPSGTGIETVPPGQLKALLPASAANLPRTRFDAQKTGMGTLKISRANATYRGGGQSVEVSITDAGGVDSFGMLAVWANMEQDRETETGYERMGKVNGRPVHEQWNKDGQNGRYEVCVASRFLVEAHGQQVDMETLRQIVNAIAFDQLEALRAFGKQ